MVFFLLFLLHSALSFILTHFLTYSLPRILLDTIISDSRFICGESTVFFTELYEFAPIVPSFNLLPLRFIYFASHVSALSLSSIARLSYTYICPDSCFTVHLRTFNIDVLLRPPIIIRYIVLLRHELKLDSDFPRFLWELALYRNFIN